MATLIQSVSITMALLMELQGIPFLNTAYEPASVQNWIVDDTYIPSPVDWAMEFLATGRPNSWMFHQK